MESEYWLVDAESGFGSLEYFLSSAYKRRPEKTRLISIRTPQEIRIGASTLSIKTLCEVFGRPISSVVRMT